MYEILIEIKEIDTTPSISFSPSASPSDSINRVDYKRNFVVATEIATFETIEEAKKFLKHLKSISHVMKGAV